MHDTRKWRIRKFRESNGRWGIYQPGYVHASHSAESHEAAVQALAFWQRRAMLAEGGAP